MKKEVNDVTFQCPITGVERVVRFAKFEGRTEKKVLKEPISVESRLHAIACEALGVPNDDPSWPNDEEDEDFDEGLYEIGDECWEAIRDFREPV